MDLELKVAGMDLELKVAEMDLEEIQITSHLKIHHFQVLAGELEGLEVVAKEEAQAEVGVVQIDRDYRLGV